MKYEEYIVRDVTICGGEPVVKGARVTLRTILASLAEGASIQDILDDFPTLTERAVCAVIAFAASFAEEDLPLPRIPLATAHLLLTNSGPFGLSDHERAALSSTAHIIESPVWSKISADRVVSVISSQST